MGPSFFSGIKVKILRLLRLQYGPTLRLYKGFGNADESTIFGHALSLAPLSRNKYRNFFLRNTTALLRLFMVKPVASAKIKVDWGGATYEVLTEYDGFFQFQLKNGSRLAPGLYKVKASWLEENSNEQVLATAESDIVVPSSADFAFVSDIDDTFLISHSANLRKRFYVLLTRNARSRRPFDGVVEYYKLLQKGTRTFFYVSSSEWNLYDYIREFIRVQKLPDGNLLLNQIKTFSKLLATGQGKHRGKFTRIVKIMEVYPQQQFVLLGDDSQQDAAIYASIAAHFPGRVYAVYIRNVRDSKKQFVHEQQLLIEKEGVHFCYFFHSKDAMEHSKKVGIV